MKARPLAPLIDEAESWGTAEWWRLEIRSFDEAPNTLMSLAVLSPKDAWTKEYGRASFGGCLRTLSYVFALTAPAVGAAWMFRWSFTGQGSMPLVFAGLLTLISVLITVSSEVSLARKPRAISMSVVRRIALVHLVPAAVTGGVAVLAVAQGTYDPQQDPTLWWLLPSVVDVAIHVWQWVRGSSRSGGPTNLVENLARSVSEIDPALRERIRQARDEAIMRLRAQAKIDPETAAHALGTDLGRLALTMAPEGRTDIASAQNDETS